MAEPNFRRMLRLLALVPRAPRRIDTEALERVLSGEGIYTTRRTLQRDLLKLEGMGLGLECSTKSKPFGWCYASTAHAIHAPGLDPQSALALRIVELHLERMLPKSTLKGLRPQFDAAKRSLTGKPVGRWLERVKLIPRSQPLLPPNVSGDVLGVVHEALLEQKQIQARYRPRGKDKADFTLHPLALVYRDSVAYLVATAFSYQDARLYPLHRFIDAAMLPERARPPADFNLEAFVDKGELGYRLSDADITLVALFDAGAAVALEETPLHVHQKLTAQLDGRVKLEASVPDTQVLRSFLLGFGAGVEVQKPVKLRKAIAEAHAAAAKRYA